MRSGLAATSSERPATLPPRYPLAMTLTETDLALLVAGFALGGVVLGGLVAGGFALFAGWLEVKREHKRWLRERGYETYLQVLVLADRLVYTTREGRRPEEKLRVEFKRESSAASAGVKMIGPEPVYKAAEALIDATNASAKFGGRIEKREEERLRARLLYVKAVQTALEIK
jgi:hypothetical protein